MHDREQIIELENDWATNPRWHGVTRKYPASEVVRLRGSIQLHYTLAEMGATRLWHLLHAEPLIRALGALTGNQAVEMVSAGLQAIYLSGWQVAGDANDALQMYPDQSLYPVSSVPNVIKQLNNALVRADQIQHMQGKNDIYWFAPIVADAEAGFGGPLNTFELIKAMIEAGAAAVHLEDQLSSLKKCGHMGGKVLVTVHEFVPKLIAARLAADVLGVPTLIVARTDSLGANLIRAINDPVDEKFATGEQTVEGYWTVKGGIEYAIAKACAYAPYADMLWCETSKPDIGEAREFAQGVHEKFPEQDAGLQLLAVVQLAAQPRREDDGDVPGEAGGDGLQIPVRHAGRLPYAEHEHVRVGACVSQSRHAGLLKDGARARICHGERGLHGDEASEPLSARATSTKCRSR